MGWTNDAHPGHEGYLVAFVLREDESGWIRLRRLGYPDDDHKLERVAAIAVACECGWQSPRFVAPLGTKWSPFSVWLPERDEGLLEACAAAQWHRHLETDALWTVNAYLGSSEPLAPLDISTPVTSIDANHRAELVARTRSWRNLTGRGQR
jgi:hypothetical protein